MPGAEKFLQISGAEMRNSRKRGKVYLIGAGPGDEGLITLKGVECLKRSDVVVYDYLVNEKLLKYCGAGCEKIYAGKRANKHTMSQSEINRLLVEKAGSGLTVARLKGGDPFVFGRGGEEALELAGNNIPFEVVPGVTAAVAALSYAGIPLTHRGLASTAAFITGHEDPAKKESDINWKKISTGAGTLVFYMGIKNLPGIVSNLKKNGRSGETPAALIRSGTLNSQETITGTLDNIAAKAEEKNFKPPALIAVGEVVNLREKLRWFDKRPLYGKRMVITRSREQASVLSKNLKDLGAYVIEFPTIAIKPVTDFSELDKAVKEIGSFTWIIFTSINGVDIFFNRLFTLGYDSRALKNVKIAVIGKGTAEGLLNFGLKPDLLPDSFTSEGTVEAFKSIKTGYSSEKMLIPSSEIARDYLPVELRKMGADVTTVPVYRNEILKYSAQAVDAVFGVNPDLVTFTSSSTVSNLVNILRKSKKECYLNSIKGASIGPVTSETAGKLGITIAVNAGEHTIPGLVDSILEYFAGDPK